MKLLAAGDVHLGRALGSIPASLARLYSPRTAWEQLIDLAVTHSVDALLLAGDVVDSDYGYFEAFGPLQRGVARLAEADIPVIMVAGNHDTSVLPKLVDGLDPAARAKVTLLGRGGEWEYYDLTAQDGSQIRVYGWSFPGSWHSGSPFVDPWPDAPGGPALRLGLLHADFESSAHRYAPVKRDDFANGKVPLWVMGHIHVQQSHRIGTGVECWYTGSLQALSAKETGVRGALFIERENTSGALRATRVPVGRLCYLDVEIDVAGLAASDDVVFQTIRQSIVDQLTQGDALSLVEMVSVDVHLHGENEVAVAEFDAVIDRMTSAGDGFVDTGQFRFRVRRRSYDLRLPEAALNLDELAAGSGFKAMLASLLLELDADAENGEQAAELLAEVKEAIGSVCRSPKFSMLQKAGREEGVPEALDVLKRQLYDLLREIVKREPKAGEGHNG